MGFFFLFKIPMGISNRIIDLKFKIYVKFKRESNWFEQKLLFEKK